MWESKYIYIDIYIYIYIYIGYVKYMHVRRLYHICCSLLSHVVHTYATELRKRPGRQACETRDLSKRLTSVWNTYLYMYICICTQYICISVYLYKGIPHLSSAIPFDISCFFLVSVCSWRQFLQAHVSGYYTWINPPFPPITQLGNPLWHSCGGSGCWHGFRGKLRREPHAWISVNFAY